MIGMLAGALAAGGGGAAAAGGAGGLAGGAFGAALSLVDANKERKARKRAEADSRPKRRKIAKLTDTASRAINNKQKALIAVAQAQQNYASMW